MEESEIVQTKIDAMKQSASPEFYERVSQLCSSLVSAINHTNKLEEAIAYCQETGVQLTFGEGMVEARWNTEDHGWKHVSGDRFLSVVNHVKEVRNYAYPSN